MTKRRSNLQKGWGGTPVPGDVLASLDELGIGVTKLTYNEAWSYCPGHENRLGRKNNKPDKWSVNIETGTHSCFSCGFSGSFVTLVQEVKGYDRADAEQWVRSRGGVSRLRRVLGVSDSSFERDSRIRERPAEWNESRLALFSDPPSSARDGRGISAGSVEHYGIRWSDGDDPFWVLPIRDPETGKLWGYQEKSETGWVSNKPYGVTKSETLFGIEKFKNPYALVLEAPLDTAVAYTSSIYGGLATFGVKISDAQFEILFDLGVPVIFGLDNDAAGIAASLEIKKKYLRSGYPIKFLNYSHIPEAKDIGSDGVTIADRQKAVLTAYSLINYRP